ncbi:ATP-dependent endonuclease [Paenibacillus sp. MZ03-122A]|uniref:ATP-dependent nuclease n=1 Tax=Paenibacillus sp. MZ03-122A TaxID=2962033 RepID=UPI0020B6F477|nr:AAA family ATPase [Paenibacillus sp. MZ03-122A]MCP3778705.1 AAA family ATPase [Paenibacillus sp. MZ03-122A]
MKISEIHVKNYRNLIDVNIQLNRLVIFIGENNSGKSNLLKALTLPFLNDEIGNISKNLGWHDININSKEKYFTFIQEKLELIKNGEIGIDEFSKYIPYVSVKITFEPEGADEFYVSRWINSFDGDTPLYTIRYQYYIENPKDLLDHIRKILKDETTIENIKMNLLPIELFKYSIINPSTEEQISYTELAHFKYNSLVAERDDFSNKNTQIGSKALVNLLQNKLSEDQKVEVEKSYENFFSDLKRISKLEGIFNWQNTSNLDNAKELFDQITLLPNMPTMGSLLNNVRLGLGEEYLYTQGLGYRNLIYLLVILNSLEVNSDMALNILTIEEPEAHLCISNEHILSSFINSILSSSEQTQLFISTHSSGFLNKLELKNVTVVSEGTAYSLKTELDEAQLDYLAKKPNLDFLKFLFSRKCILVEGPTEEMLIRSYLNSQTNYLNDIEVISLHKGFTKMLDIWLKVNQNSTHRIGVIRDYDNQPKAQELHEKYNIYSNIYVTTTTRYTLEPEFVQTGSNFEKLKNYFANHHGWGNIDNPEDLSDKWREAKADTMLKFCQNFGTGDLSSIELPHHISKVINFLQSREKM